MDYNVEKEWITEEGYKAVVIRMNRSYLDHRCGYVGIPKDHKWHGNDYLSKVKVPKEILERDVNIDKVGIINLFCADISEEEKEAGLVDVVLAIDVHGGLTYSGSNAKYPIKNEGLWFFGFDCAHCDDNEDGGQSLEYCIKECESLSRQLGVFR